MGGLRAKGGKGGAMLTPNELVLTFAGLYVCVNFGENRPRNATVTVRTDTHTDTKQLYSLSHAICYSYGADRANSRVCFLVHC